MRRRTLLLAPLAHRAWATDAAAAPEKPDRQPDSVGPTVDPTSFAGLGERIATYSPDVESVVVVRDNRLLFEYYKAGAGAEALRHIESATKSVLSMMTGVALARGALSSVDQPVLELVARLMRVQNDTAATKLTIKHLLSMTAGFGRTGRVTRAESDDPAFLLGRARAAAPGEAFSYDNPAANLLSIALEGAVGSSVSAFASSYLFEQLGIRNVEWEQGPNGHNYGSGGLRLRTRDMAALGQLMLGRGNWQGRQLMSQSYAGEAVSPQSQGGAPVGLPYGYMWWLTPSEQGTRTFFASGFGGQFIWVHIPLGLVIATTSEVSGRSNAKGQALALIRNELFNAASAWRPT
jgi:CubicO group peptidase (beta-lactamase class C family)